MQIYWDYNATTPVDSRVLDKMLPFFNQYFGNAASNTHYWGWTAAEAVKEARGIIAECIGAGESEIVFTSGATEAINLALKGAAEIHAPGGNHIITVQTEHKAVLDTCEYLSERGINITYLPVNHDGLVDTEEVKRAFTPGTFLVCVMMANNETGVIQPIREIAAIAHQHQAWMMSDCVQAFGKVPLNVDDLGIDIMPLSAHKFYGPKGVGALYLRRRNPRVKLSPLIHGGGHEKGLRSGTLNVPGIVGMAKAAEICMETLMPEYRRLEALRNRLESFLIEKGEAKINGSITQRLSHVSSLSFPSVKSETLLSRIPQLAISSGSACTSALQSPSHVLMAMGLSEAEAYGSLRFSLGRFTTEEEILRGGEILLKALQTMIKS